MDLTKELPFKVGDEIKNYKEMCRLLGEKQRAGNSKKSQLNRWQNYFSWEQVGHRFKIIEVIKSNYPTHDDNYYTHGNIKQCHRYERHKHDFQFYHNYNEIRKDFSCSLQSDSVNYNKIIYLLMGMKLTLNHYEQRELRVIVKNKTMYFKYKGNDIRGYLEKLLSSEQIATVSMQRIEDSLKKKTMEKHKEVTYYVYMFADKNKDIIYVGRTNSLKQRMYKHFDTGHLPPQAYYDTQCIYYLPLQNASEMALLELYYINKYKPKYNTMDKFDSPFYYVRQFELKNWEKLPNELIEELKSLMSLE